MIESAEVSFERVGGVAVVRFHGEIDLANAERTGRRAEDEILALDGECRAVALDVSQLAYLDSSGLRMLEDLREASTKQTLPTYVVAPAGCRARRLFDLTGLTEHLACRDDLDAVHRELASERS
jgi:anti-anti-sigma factor